MKHQGDKLGQPHFKSKLNRQKGIVIKGVQENSQKTVDETIKSVNYLMDIELIRPLEDPTIWEHEQMIVSSENEKDLVLVAKDDSDFDEKKLSRLRRYLNFVFLKDYNPEDKKLFTFFKINTV